RRDQAETEGIAQNIDESRGKEIIECVYIGGDASKQPSHRIAIVERQIEPLQMFHDLAAQIEHGVLAGVLHKIRLRELAEECPHDHSQVKQSNEGDAVPRVRRKIWVEERRRSRALVQVAVDGGLRQQRAKYLQARLRQQEHQR